MNVLAEVPSRALLVGAALGLIACLAPSRVSAQNVFWPAFGPRQELPRLDGITDTVPDIIGPVDGSAELTIFTEGNHYPVLLPLVLTQSVFSPAARPRTVRRG